MNGSGTDSSAPKPWGIWFTLAATVAIAVACAALIWYRFVITPETNCIIAVSGNENYSGDTVEVLPKVAADPDHARLAVKLSEANQYSARFFLTSATYQVRVLRPDGSPVIDLTDFVPPGRRWSYDLTRAVAANRLPTTWPATTR